MAMTRNQAIKKAYAGQDNRSKEILDWISECNRYMTGNQRGLLQEAAYYYGAETIDDDCNVVTMTTDALVDLLVVTQSKGKNKEEDDE